MKIELDVTARGVDEVITLEYNRDAIKSMEARGFDFNHIGDKFVTNADLMLEGAMRMHHDKMNATIRKHVIDAIYEQYDAGELYTQLIEMCMDSIPAIKDMQDGNNEKKKSTVIK